MKHHTPGPWRISSDLIICADTIAHGQVELATVHRESEYMARLPFEANARLIAAAPHLLEAAKGALQTLDRLPADTLAVPGISRILRAAIAKAEGKP